MKQNTQLHSFFCSLEYGSLGTTKFKEENMQDAIERAKEWALDGDWPKPGEVRLSVQQENDDNQTIQEHTEYIWVGDTDDTDTDDTNDIDEQSDQH